MLDNKLSTMYFKMPIIVQNVMVSLYGLFLYHQRYGFKCYGNKYILANNEMLPKESVITLQNHLYNNIVKHAVTTVPFYKRWLHNNNLSIRDVMDISNISLLPIIEKDWIRENPTDFCSEIYLNKKNSFWLNTSGTSGKPLRILCDNESRRLHYLFWTRLRESYDIRPGSKRATFFGRTICSSAQVKPPFWRYDMFGKNLLFSSYHMSQQNLEYYISKLTEYNPTEIIGYPSSLFVLSKYLIRNGVTNLKPKVVITTAETLLAYQREVIAAAFKESTVVDQYGCTEMALFVSQCQYGNYHLHADHSYVETMVDEKIISSEGECSGEVICTGFINKAMPLLRYRLGDYLSINYDMRCACGRSFPVITQILGRSDDILITPEGRPIGRLDPIFKGVRGVCETQIIQLEKDKIVIKIVVDSQFSKEQEKCLIKELENRVGANIQIILKFVNSIPKDKNGKFKAVISKVKNT